MANKHKRELRRIFREARERPPMVDGEPDAPAVVVHRLLKSAQRDRANAVNALREETRQQVQRHRDRHVGLAREVATTLHEMRGLLDRNDAPMHAAGLDTAVETLTALHRRLAKVVQSTGVRLIDPEGERYLDVADHTDVKGRPGGVDDADLVVGQTISPGVLLDDGELVCPAEVFLETAAEPPEAAGDSAGEAAQSDAAAQEPAPQPAEGEGAAKAEPDETEERAADMAAESAQVPAQTATEEKDDTP
ncbi:prolipoprotein diacylglyceryl transferase [Streptomonospora litoralis]|uniref:Nucleotide exchange factor GrpE n=1 Tax=Streptomonospora litoralis TaxID=2498135 RepID=A0A4P6Q2F2_9ACTN|nr:hypothetical protein [Streptomonospora litoralis]QBI53039.1 hypothetical protein EKD16_06205 [Streptomonospora litoralis]